MLHCFGSPSLAPPAYEHDPFGDRDFDHPELILEEAFPTKGRGEMALMVTNSMVDKYTSHVGLMLDFNWHLSETFGVGLTAGYLHGSLTSIVTDAAGILGNKVAACQQDPANCNDINPNVPDYLQITGVLDAVAMWSPLYGKISIVSEVDLAVQLYVLAGFGVNGTRRAVAQTTTSPAGPKDYRLRNSGFGDTGFFNDPKLNGTLGFGLRFFVVDWLALKGEVRGIFFRDSFDFNQDGIRDRYISQIWFTQLGLAFLIRGP